MLLAADEPRVVGPVVGTFTVDERRVEVIDQSVHNYLLWLYILDGTKRLCLGVVRWDETHTPRLTIAVGEIDWVQSGSPRAEALVSGAMSVYRSAKSACAPFRRVSQYPARLPFVFFDVAGPHARPFPRPRGVATVPQPRKGD